MTSRKTVLEATMNEDPWKGLAIPDASQSIKAKRVDAEQTWGFFWARSIDNKCMLVLQHDESAKPSAHLPKIRGIELLAIDGDAKSRPMLIFKLEQTEQRDLFHRLCLDIMDCSSSAVTEKDAVHRAIARTWRWHHLLRGGGDNKLSTEEQKGMIGELVVLEQHLLPQLSASDAVASWQGPRGAPKDFAIGGVCIEAKSRRGGAAPHVLISSESQLDESDLEALFLHVTAVDRTPADACEGLSLTAFVERVRTAITMRDPGAAEAFDEAIAATGFRSDDDYSDELWLEGISRLYRICDDFPRITASSVSTGVHKVRYAISLVQCEPYEVEPNMLADLIGGR